MTDLYPADKQRFREAMSRLGAAVNIITTRTPNGDIGFTASAVCSVTDDPATLLVCMNRNSRNNAAFKAAGILAVNVLPHEQEKLSPIFAGAGDLPMADRFAAATWLRLVTGAPILEGAATGLDCTIDQITEIGTHSVFFCGVKAIHLGSSNSGLIYHGRAYHKIGADKAA
jgi:flavin reductase